jgi:regulator of nucleoside diphosphate kinase
MKDRKIYITKSDRARLLSMLASTRRFLRRHPEDLEVLCEDLESAEVVRTETELPSDRIVLNCTFRARDIDSLREKTFTLVMPRDANYDEGKVSVLAPMGVALFGARVGETVVWNAPAGVKRFQIRHVYPTAPASKAA